MRASERAPERPKREERLEAAVCYARSARPDCWNASSAREKCFTVNKKYICKHEVRLRSRLTSSRQGRRWVSVPHFEKQASKERLCSWLRPVSGPDIATVTAMDPGRSAATAGSLRWKANGSSCTRSKYEQKEEIQKRLHAMHERNCARCSRTGSEGAHARCSSLCTGSLKIQTLGKQLVSAIAFRSSFSSIRGVLHLFFLSFSTALQTGC